MLAQARVKADQAGADVDVAMRRGTREAVEVAPLRLRFALGRGQRKGAGNALGPFLFHRLATKTTLKLDPHDLTIERRSRLFVDVRPVRDAHRGGGCVCVWTVLADTGFCPYSTIS